MCWYSGVMTIILLGVINNTLFKNVAFPGAESSRCCFSGHTSADGIFSAGYKGENVWQELLYFLCTQLLNKPSKTPMSRNFFCPCFSREFFRKKFFLGLLLMICKKLQEVLQANIFTFVSNSESAKHAHKRKKTARTGFG